MDCNMPASLSFPISQSLLKLVSFEPAMPSNHLILHFSFLPHPSIFPSIRFFSSELVLCIRWPRHWRFSFNISPFNEYSGLISFRMDRFDLAEEGISQVFSSTTAQRHQIFLFWMILFFKFIYFNWRLITLQYCGGFRYTLTWISHGCTCVPHPEPPPTSLPIPSLRVIPVHQPWAPCLMHQTWTGDLFHIWECICFNAILSNHPTLAFSHRVRKAVIYFCVSFAISHIGPLLPSF